MTISLEAVTLGDVHARTRADGQCLIWTGHANAGKYPQWRIGGKLYPARRVVWILTRGPIPEGMQIGVKCPNELCIAPNCLVCRSKGAAAPGYLTPDARIRIALARRRGSMLTPEMVREIRSSEETAKSLDQRFNLSAGYASRIRTGRAWREFASPFAGLGARE